MKIPGRAALSGAPYLVDEVVGMIRQTAVDSNLKVHAPGKPYTMTTDIREMLEGFLARCRERGIFLLCKMGRPLSIARAKAGAKEVMEAYTILMKSHLKAYQAKYGKWATKTRPGSTSATLRARPAGFCASTRSARTSRCRSRGRLT